MANFQYLVTCLAFSISKPFRKQIWTNWPYMISIVCILVVDFLVLFLPAESFLPKMFGCVPFEKDGQSYYSYKAWVGLGILLNSILTYLAETFIILGVTHKADKRAQMKKRTDFLATMDSQAA